MLEILFQMFDQDGSGDLDPKELFDVMSQESFTACNTDYSDPACTPGMMECLMSCVQTEE